MRIFAAQSGIWENPRIALVKSSLVFVLVEGCRLAALKFLARLPHSQKGAADWQPSNFVSIQT